MPTVTNNQVLPLSLSSVRKHDLEGRALYVVDGCFSSGLIDMAYFFLKSVPFQLSGYDSEETKHVMHWSYEFKIDENPTLPFLRSIFTQVISVTEELFTTQPLQLKRIHCNNHLYGDLQYPHQDLTPGVTALYFANPVWNRNWMGETIFYGAGDEPVYAVIPKPGRVIAFAADIVHRGGVPSRECFEPRLSLAFKFRVKND